jgi:hypothetical protein
MSSQARINASRANGRKSRGPKTAAGKAISSQNALRHGLVASTILIEGESAERFEALLASLVAEYEPKTETEMQLIENMAVCKWKQLRIWALENVGHTEEIRRQRAASSEMAAKSLAERAYYALAELIETKRIMDAMHRYESRFDRQYMRALSMLEDIRKANK